MNFNQLELVIKSRRSIYPANYLDIPIEKSTITKLLELANWAPNHRNTEPWRFKVFHSDEAMLKLSNYLGEQFMNSGKPYSEIKYQKTVKKPLKSGCVIAICMNRSGDTIIPEWEEIAAVSCAVQNLWLGCNALNIGAYWSTPSSITTNSKEFLGLTDTERCLGLFYMGYCDQKIDVSSSRSKIEGKLTYM